MGAWLAQWISTCLPSPTYQPTYAYKLANKDEVQQVVWSLKVICESNVNVILCQGRAAFAMSQRQ